MRRWGIWVALLLSVGLNLGLFGALLVRDSARPSFPGVGPEREPRRPGVFLAQRLGLEGQERQRFLDLHEALVAEIGKERRQLFELRRQLRTELAASRASREAALELVAQIGTHQATLERLLVDHVFEVRRVLPPEPLGRYLRWLSRVPPPNPEIMPGVGRPLRNRFRSERGPNFGWDGNDRGPYPDPAREPGGRRESSPP